MKSLTWHAMLCVSMLGALAYVSIPKSLMDRMTSETVAPYVPAEPAPNFQQIHQPAPVTSGAGV